MSKLSKCFFITIDLILLTVFSSVVLIYYQHAQLNIDLMQYRAFLFDNDYVGMYLLAVSLLMITCLIIGLLIILFYPRKTAKYLLKDQRGRLEIDKKAIASFVRTSLVNERIAFNPKVAVRATPKKIKLTIVGQLPDTDDLVAKQSDWKEKVSNDLHTLLGLQQKVVIDVKFVDQPVKKYKKNEPRVQ